MTAELTDEQLARIEAWADDHLPQGEVNLLMRLVQDGPIVANLLAEARAEGRKEAAGAICWDTTCLNCAAMMDKNYEMFARAEKAESEAKRHQANYNLAMQRAHAAEAELASSGKLLQQAEAKVSSGLALADEWEDEAEKARLGLVSGFAYCARQLRAALADEEES